MNEAERVFAQCGAAPDDDAPRLVWADLVGGERGELVVIQCDLARGGLSPREAAIRRRRERELLDKHAVEWAGPIATRAKRWSFRRGFVETVVVDLASFDPALLRDWPMIRSLTLENLSDGDDVGGIVPFLDGLAAIGLRGSADHTEPWLEALAPMPLTGLRAFSIDNLDRRGAPYVIEIVRREGIRQLRLTEHALEPAELAAVLDAPRELHALEVTRGMPFELVARHPLRALRIGGLGDGDRASFERGGELLRHVASVTRLPGWALDQIAQLPALRSLEVAVDPPMLDGLIAAVGDRIERLAVTMIGGADSELRDAIARRAGEVAFDLELRENWPTEHDELVHEAADAVGTLGRACCERYPPATFVRTDQLPHISHVPPMPLDMRVGIGRGMDNIVMIPLETVARRHAALEWCGDHYEIRDADSSNGTIVNGTRVTRGALADGDTLQLGTATLRFFVGEDARRRGKSLLLARQRVTSFQNVIRSLGDQRCLDLASRVEVDPSKMPAIANALVDCLVREVLVCPGDYATFHDPAKLRALAPIRDARTREAARRALWRELDLGQEAGALLVALDLIDELEAFEHGRDVIWHRLWIAGGSMNNAFSNARAAGITELPRLVAATLERLVTESA